MANLVFKFKYMSLKLVLLQQNKKKDPSNLTFQTDGYYIFLVLRWIARQQLL